ncbi:hypothetical protein S83_054279 [Arachis hypogaea]
MAHSHTNTLIRKQRDLLLVATGHIVATGHHHHTAPCVVVERTASSPPSVARCTASSRVGAPCASVVVVAFSPGVARGCCCLAVCVIAVVGLSLLVICVVCMLGVKMLLILASVRRLD